MGFDPSAARSGGVFSEVPNYAAGWLCYVNGIEVPIKGFDIQYGVWQVPSFRIHMVPDLLLQRLGSEDRVPVQIFYLDHWVDEKNPEWRLLVDGEIIGWSQSNSSNGRTLTFQCSAHIQMFQQLYFFYMTNVDDVVAAQSPEVRASGFTTPGLNFPYSLFHQGLMVTREQINAVNAENTNATPLAEGTDASAPIKTPYELVTNVIKGVIASAVPAERKALPAINFFARHIRKTRSHNRWVRLPLLEDATRIGQQRGVFPIFNAARNDEALIAMQRHMASQVSNSGSVWNLYQQLLSLVYMEIAMIPNPACVRVALGTGLGDQTEGTILGPLEATTPLVEQRAPTPPVLASGVAPAASAGSANVGVNPTTPVRLAQHFVKPQFLFGVPPHCNVIFPSMMDGFMLDENYSAQPTRVYVNDSVMTRLLRAQGPNRDFMLHALTVGFPEEADALMHHKTASTLEAGSAAAPGMRETGKNLLIWPEEYFKGPVTARMQLPTWFQMLRQFSNSAAKRPSGGDTNDPTAAPNASGGAPTNSANNSAPVSQAQTRSTLSQGTTTVPNVSSQPLPPLSRVSVVGPVVAETRRGSGELVVRDRARPDWPYRWIISDEARRIGETKWVRSDPAPRYREVTPRRNPNGTNNWQQPISRYLTVLGNHLKERFPGVITNFFLHGRRPTEPVDPNARMDVHVAGRANDLMIPTIRVGRQFSLPDLARMNPIADYLVMNCDVFGVQYLTWARSQWSSSARQASRKFTHYTARPDEERFDHSNHIHMELNLDGANGLLPFYGGNTSAPRVPQTAPVRTVFGPPARVNTQNATTPLAGQTNDPNATASQRTVTSSNAATPHVKTPVNSNDSFAQLFRLYAQYEYLRNRYMQRQASVQMKFNPYIVPGFPTVIFDSMTTRQHIVGYVQNVTQQGSADGQASNLSTSVSVTCVRTFPEFLNDVRADADRFRGRVTAAPAEIISSIREVIQDEEQAEQFYRGIFYANNIPLTQRAAFRFTEAVGYSRNFTPENIDILGPSVAEVEEQERRVEETRAGSEDGETASTAQTQAQDAVNARTVTHNIDPNLELSPKDPYDKAFDNYHVAMRMNARPVCTLNEFIRFWHAGRTLGDLEASGDVEGPTNDWAYNVVVEEDVIATGVDASNNPQNIRGPAERKPATYYRRIFKLRPGPGVGEDRLTGPTAAERGYTDPPNIQPSSVSSGVSATYPQTRADWDQVLLMYREKVRTLVRPGT